MVKQNILFLAGKSIIFDIVGDIIYFPLWWYTAGLKNLAVSRLKNISATADHLALRLLLLNAFKPMFAQYDRAGRIISFFMRIVILIGRAIYFFIYVLLQLCIIVIWIGVPVFIFYRLVSIYILPYAAG